MSKVEAFREKYDQGLALLAEGRDQEAHALLLDAARTAPEGWLQLATELIKEKEYDLALDRLREVLALTQDARIRAAAVNNVGMVLAHKGQTAEALACFKEASQMWPQFPDSYSNIGLCHMWAGRYPEALRWLDRALAFDPWHEQAQFARSMTLLMSCDWPRGWDEYECRWRSGTNGMLKIASPTPEWNGANGKRLFVYGEQGHGDTILMARYAREIRARGVWQCWVCQKSMRPLLETVPEIDQVIEAGETLPDFDCHIPAVSLPRIFRTTPETIPPAPYIPKPEPFDYGPGVHVGIAWRGSHAQGNDHIRSTRLLDWLPVLSIDGVTFHSLQVDHADEGLVYPQLEHHELPKNWLDSARRVSGLSLVCSVDTSLVHLCGALGVECWCALHSRPYFVYPPKFGTATPWYPSVKLYRQPREFAWRPVFEQIAKDLICRFKTS